MDVHAVLGVTQADVYKNGCLCNACLLLSTKKGTTPCQCTHPALTLLGFPRQLGLAKSCECAVVQRTVGAKVMWPAERGFFAIHDLIAFVDFD